MFKTLCHGLTLVLLTVGCVSLSLGQEKGESTGVFENGKEYDRFIGSAKRAAYESGNPEMIAMIPLLNDIALGKEIGSTARQYGAVGNELGLLANRKIREEIEMVDDQFEEFQELSRDIQQRMARQVREMDFSEPEVALKRIREMRTEAQDELNRLLLPHQVSRLKQIRMQVLLQKQSLLQVLSSDPLRSDLDISEGQIEKMRSAEKEINRKLAEKIAKLRAEAHDELLEALEPTQRKEVKEMIGDAYNVQPLVERGGGEKKRIEKKPGKWNKGK